MTSTIPFSEVVSVVPSVLSANGSAVDLNGLMLTQNVDAPYGAVLEFATAADVSTYFGGAATETALASIYFGGYSIGTKRPGKLLMARYPEAAIAGTLRSGSLAGITLAQLKALSGTVILTVAGTVFTSSSVTLTGAASFSAAAALIQAAFTTPTFTVTFDSLTNAFVFTTNTSGATQTITYATGTLAAGINLTQATGAVTSQGADIATPATFMSNILLKTQNWATFMTAWEPVIAEKEAFADWSNTNQPRWLYVCQDSDATALTANSTATFGNYLQTNKHVGTLPIYGDATHAAFVCGFAASLDFSRTNGRATLDFKMQSGLVASVTNATDYAAVLSNGYNCYGYFGSNNPANNANWFTPGSVSGSWAWADTYLNQIWLNANLQLAVVNLLQAVGSVPYNTQGYGLIRSAALAPINDAVNFGAIRQGVALSATQTAEMQFTLGLDVSAAVTAKGYYLQILPATAAIRSARQSPPITLYYQDGESIQKINLASIAIQ